MNGPALNAVIWRFDENRRVYPKKVGKFDAGSSPIWREHWVRMIVWGQNSRSWLVDHYFDSDHQWTPRAAFKLPKKGPWPGWAFSEADIDELEWLHLNGWKIVNRLGTMKDPAIMRQIAKLMGYES